MDGPAAPGVKPGALSSSRGLYPPRGRSSLRRVINGWELSPPDRHNLLPPAPTAGGVPLRGSSLSFLALRCLMSSQMLQTSLSAPSAAACEGEGRGGRAGPGGEHRAPAVPWAPGPVRGIRQRDFLLSFPRPSPCRAGAAQLLGGGCVGAPSSPQTPRVPPAPPAHPGPPRPLPTPMLGSLRLVPPRPAAAGCGGKESPAGGRAPQRPPQSIPQGSGWGLQLLEVGGTLGHSRLEGWGGRAGLVALGDPVFP